MGGDGGPISFARGSPPAEFVVRSIVLPPASDRAYRAGEWRDALVVVERGTLELVTMSGVRAQFAPGAILFLDGLHLRALCNGGQATVRLVAVSRRGPSRKAGDAA